jgi:hypothetical protein
VPGPASSIQGRRYAIGSAVDQHIEPSGVAYSRNDSLRSMEHSRHKDLYRCFKDEAQHQGSPLSQAGLGTFI